MLDLPGLDELLRALHRRELSLVEVETPTASPFASSLLFDYVATYMYEGDTPNAERRAAALSLDRDLLRELLGQEELRELIDPGALDQVEDDLQHRSERTRAANARRAARRAAARRRPDGRRGARRACSPAATRTPMLERAAARAPRRARARSAARSAGSPPQDAGLYRDALGVVAAGRPARRVPRGRARRARAARAPLRADARPVHHRRGCASATASIPAPRCASSSATGDLVRGELRPGGTEREWCDAEVLRRLRRASLAVLRKEIEPADQRALRRASCRRGRASTATRRAGAGRRPAARGARAPAGPRAARRSRGSATCCRAASAPTRRRGWTSCAPRGELVWVGAGALGRSSGRVALYFREDVAARRPAAASRAIRRPSRRTRRSATRLRAGAVLLHRPARRRRRSRPRSSRRRCGTSCGRARRPTTRSRRCARRGSRSPGPSASARRARARPPLLRRAAAARRRRSRAAGRSPSRCSRAAPDPGRSAGARWPSCCSSATGSSPASRCWPRACPAASPRSTTRWRSSRRSASRRRGYFVEGLGGAQFALPGAVERLRAQRADDGGPPLVLAATDPAQPYGAALPWPKRDGERARARSASPGAYVVSPAPSPSSTWSAAGKGSLTLVEPDDPRVGARASRRSPTRSGPGASEAGAGAGRRRAGLRRAVRRAAGRARLPPVAPGPDAQRLKIAPRYEPGPPSRRRTATPRTVEYPRARLPNSERDF